MSNFIVNTDIPNLRVVIREGDQYNINIVPGRITTLVTGSFTSYADLAGVALTASYVSGASVTAETASYAQVAETINVKTVTENTAFQISFISQSHLAVDTSQHLTFNPTSHILQISGGIGNGGGVAAISPQGVTFTSGSNFAGLLEKFGVFNRVDNKTVGVVADPSKINGALVNQTNPGIYVTSGTLQTTGYVPLEFQASGSYTDGRVTVNTPLVTKQGIQVTGSVEAPDGFTGSLYGTASVADGIDVVIAGIYETGSDGVIIPAPSGGYTYISTASYALTASYIANNTWDNLLNIPIGLLSSSVQVYPLPVESSSYALTASYAMNGGGGGGAGSSGTSGTSGTAGSSGTSGAAGSSGTSGSSGTAGSSGTSATLPSGVISGSAQIAALGYATTGSNVFNGNQVITGSLSVSNSASFNGPVNANDSTLLLSTSSSLVLTSGSLITVFSPGYVTGSIRSTELVLPLTGSTPPQTGSMFYSASFIYVYDGTRYRSASLF